MSSLEKRIQCINQILDLADLTTFKSIYKETYDQDVPKNVMGFYRLLPGLLEKYSNTALMDELKSQLSSFFLNLIKRKDNDAVINSIEFAHNYEANSFNAIVRFVDIESKDILMGNPIDLTSFWGFFWEQGFMDFSDDTELMELGEDEFTLLIAELFKLKSYVVVREILLSDYFKSKISSISPSDDFAIIISELDASYYEIYLHAFDK